MAISPQRFTIYLYSAHRAVIFAIAQLSCQRYYSFCTPKATFSAPTPILAKISGCSPWNRSVTFGLQRAKP